MDTPQGRSPQPRVLITGATGFVGARLAERLAPSADVIRCARTSATDGWQLDLAESLPTVDQLTGVQCVVHLAAVAHTAPPSTQAELDRLFTTNDRVVDALAEQCERAGVERFVFVSTSKVLGDESWAPLSEDAPYAPRGAYAGSKAAAERALLKRAERSAMAVCIVRPPLVYGPGVQANYLLMLKLAASGLPLPLGEALRPRSFVFVTNLVEFLAGTTVRGTGIYHVTDPESVSVSGLLAEMRAALGQPKRLFNVSERMVRGLAGMIGRGEAAARLFDAMELSDQHARREFGWHPPVTREAALKETVDWYLSSRT